MKSFKQTGIKTSHLSEDETTRKCYQCDKVLQFSPGLLFQNCDLQLLQNTRTSLIGMLQENFAAKPGFSKGTAKVQSIETCALSNTSDDFCRISRLQVPVDINSTCLRIGT